MESHRITGGGGAQLHVVETGNPRGRPIVFIHGFSQCWLAWSRQLNSALADDHRLVAVDLRGHGLSDKPSDGYGDSRLWADDIDAVIRTWPRPADPVRLVLWFPALDYIRHYGETRSPSTCRSDTKIAPRTRCRSRFLRQVSLPRTSTRASAASNHCYVCASHKSLQPRICTSCWATTYRFLLPSVRRCSPVRSTTTMFWRRFVSLYC